MQHFCILTFYWDPLSRQSYLAICSNCARYIRILVYGKSFNISGSRQLAVVKINGRTGQKMKFTGEYPRKNIQIGTNILYILCECIWPVYMLLIVVFSIRLGFFVRNLVLPPVWFRKVLKLKKQRETKQRKEPKIARFEPSASKSQQKLSFFPVRPLDFTPRVRRNWIAEQF